MPSSSPPSLFSALVSLGALVASAATSSPEPPEEEIVTVNAWLPLKTQAHSSPRPAWRFAHASVLWNATSALISHGYNFRDPQTGVSVATFLDDTWLLSPPSSSDSSPSSSLATWRRLAMGEKEEEEHDIAPQGRYGHALVRLGSSAWMFGGDNGGNHLLQGYRWSGMNDLWRLGAVDKMTLSSGSHTADTPDASELKWRPVTTVAATKQPAPRSLQSCTVIPVALQSCPISLPPSECLSSISEPRLFVQESMVCFGGLVSADSGQKEEDEQDERVPESSDSSSAPLTDSDEIWVMTPVLEDETDQLTGLPMRAQWSQINVNVNNKGGSSSRPAPRHGHSTAFISRVVIRDNSGHSGSHMHRPPPSSVDEIGNGAEEPQQQPLTVEVENSIFLHGGSSFSCSPTELKAAGLTVVFKDELDQMQQQQQQQQRRAGQGDDASLSGLHAEVIVSRKNKGSGAGAADKYECLFGDTWRLTWNSPSPMTLEEARRWLGSDLDAANGAPQGIYPGVLAGLWNDEGEEPSEEADGEAGGEEDGNGFSAKRRPRHKRSGSPNSDRIVFVEAIPSFDAASLVVIPPTAVWEKLSFVQHYQQQQQQQQQQPPSSSPSKNGVLGGVTEWLKQRAAGAQTAALEAATKFGLALVNDDTNGNDEKQKKQKEKEKAAKKSLTSWSARSELDLTKSGAAADSDDDDDDDASVLDLHPGPRVGSAMTLEDGGHGLVLFGGGYCTPSCRVLGDGWKLSVPPVTIVRALPPSPPPSPSPSPPAKAQAQTKKPKPSQPAKSSPAASSAQPKKQTREAKEVNAQEKRAPSLFGKKTTKAVESAAPPLPPPPPSASSAPKQQQPGKRTSEEKQPSLFASSKSKGAAAPSRAAKPSASSSPAAAAPAEQQQEEEGVEPAWESPVEVEEVLDVPAPALQEEAPVSNLAEPAAEQAVDAQEEEQAPADTAMPVNELEAGADVEAEVEGGELEGAEADPIVALDVAGPRRLLQTEAGDGSAVAGTRVRHSSHGTAVNDLHWIPLHASSSSVDAYSASSTSSQDSFFSVSRFLPSSWSPAVREQERLRKAHAEANLQGLANLASSLRHVAEMEEDAARALAKEERTEKELAESEEVISLDDDNSGVEEEQNEGAAEAARQKRKERRRKERKQRRLLKKIKALHDEIGTTDPGIRCPVHSWLQAALAESPLSIDPRSREERNKEAAKSRRRRKNRLGRPDDEAAEGSSWSSRIRNAASRASAWIQDTSAKLAHRMDSRNNLFAGLGGSDSSTSAQIDKPPFILGVDGPEARYRHTLVSEYRRSYLATLVRASMILQRLRYLSFSHGLNEETESKILHQIIEVVENEEEHGGPAPPPLRATTPDEESEGSGQTALAKGKQKHHHERVKRDTLSSVSILFGGEAMTPFSSSSTYFDDAWLWLQVEQEASDAQAIADTERLALAHRERQLAAEDEERFPFLVSAVLSAWLLVAVALYCYSPACRAGVKTCLCRVCCRKKAPGRGKVQQHSVLGRA